VRRFLYFYLMKNNPDQVRITAPKHAEYWKSLSLEDYEGGPFADRSGGLIIFSAHSWEQAQALASEDPFRTAGVIETSWVKQWVPEPACEVILA